MDIKEARKQIDGIDAQLVELFEQRLSIIKFIGKFKDEHHLPLIDEDRDQEIISSLKTNSKDPRMLTYEGCYFY